MCNVFAVCRTTSPTVCANACMSDLRCKCAYLLMTGRCILDVVSCKDPANGIVYNSERSSLAFHPCRAHNDVSFPGALDDYSTIIDWDGLFDDYCEGDSTSVVIPHQESYCGPECHIKGTKTVTYVSLSIFCQSH